MVALSLWRDGRCAGCGGSLDETLAHEDWEALPPLRCHKCKAVAIAQDRFEDKHPHTLRWGAKRRGW
jgi:hypothetical protein